MTKERERFLQDLMTRYECAYNVLNINSSAQRTVHPRIKKNKNGKPTGWIELNYYMRGAYRSSDSVAAAPLQKMTETLESRVHELQGAVKQ